MNDKKNKNKFNDNLFGIKFNNFNFDGEEEDYSNLKKNQLVIDNPIQFCVLVVEEEI